MCYVVIPFRLVPPNMAGPGGRCSEHTASHTALRALTDPASLSKDASVSNEHLQEIAREAHVSSLFDGRSDSDSECAQPHSVLFSAYSLLLLCLCPVFCLLNSLPPACVFVCLLASALPPTCLCFVFSPIHRSTSRQKNAALGGWWVVADKGIGAGSG